MAETTAAKGTDVGSTYVWLPVLNEPRRIGGGAVFWRYPHSPLPHVQLFLSPQPPCPLSGIRTILSYCAFLHVRYAVL